MKRVVVTGAFSYTGAAVAGALLSRGHVVHTLTNREPPSGAGRITHAPLAFDVDTLARELEGADAFVNTFWVRLPHGGQTFQSAVARSRCLIEAAERAGTRFVHVSVSNAAAGRNLGYYRGKADVEEALRSSRLRYAIVRPTLVVGPSDVLTNNIAWFLRRFPVFPMPGGGSYRLQPVTLGDVGRIVADAVEGDGPREVDAADGFRQGGAMRDAPLDVDAAGPETFTFAAYVRLIAEACGLRRPFVSVPDRVALAGLGLVEPLLDDVVLTREELQGLAQELLLSHAPALGRESVRAWMLRNGASLGRRYVNDLDRHFRQGARTPVLDPTTLEPLAPSGRR
jgi:NADH dehydrogenase